MGEKPTSVVKDTGPGAGAYNVNSVSIMKSNPSYSMKKKLESKLTELTPGPG